MWLLALVAKNLAMPLDKVANVECMDIFYGLLHYAANNS